ncbi:hypothetical protein [Vibrio phage vB_VpaP_SJSY21]|nr:hypothetical protein [Vibrio phage vB_VpaP_SJSY21]
MSSLVIKFGDNDFGCSLLKLGEWVLEEGLTAEVLNQMSKRGEINEILTRAFRSCCILYQNRFDMYVNWERDGETISDMDRYAKGDYYKITNARVVNEYPLDWENGETLVVDLTNKQVHVI